MIYVFKTSVKTKNAVKKLKLHIDPVLSAENWNFDLQDFDKILRVDCERAEAQEVANLLTKHKFRCEELE